MAHVRSLTYCYKTIITNKNGQMIVDRKELSKKRTDGRLKKGNILNTFLSSREANMRLHISAFLQKHPLL